jgi:hypothetical protein
MDNAERAHQVQHMRDIYSQTARVIVWLGEPKPDTHEAWNFVRELANRMVFCDKMRFTRDLKSWLAAQGQTPQHGLLLALRELMQRPYWTRTWIVQEICVAKEVIVQCGRLAMPWNYFVGASSALKTYSFAITESMAQILEQDFRSASGDLDDVAMIQEYDALINPVDHGFRSIEMIAKAKSDYSQQSQPEAFYDVVRYFRYADSPDPRDKIFAVLGLASERHREVAALKPDYEIALEDLYFTMVRVHIETRQNLDFLGDSCGIHHPPGFSSWMPHWERPSQVSMIRPNEVGLEVFTRQRQIQKWNFPFLFLKRVSC